MKKLFLALTILGGSLCGRAEAQVGTPKWRFTSRGQVVPALQKTRGNLRGTYEVIVCAVRQGYQNTALGFYEGIVEGKTFDASAQDSAAYAFAYSVCEGIVPWNWKRDGQRGNIKNSSRSRARLFADRAMRMAPNNPEVLIMRAFSEFTGLDDDRKEAYEMALKATKRAPLWADAHYWLGRAAENYAMTFYGKKAEADRARMVQLARLSLRSYNASERLDPSLKIYQYLLKAYACEIIADKECVRMIPIYIDAYLRATPEFISWYEQKYGKTEAQYRQSWAERVEALKKKMKS